MGEPLCKIARENGGDVPLECLFHCPHNCLPATEPQGSARCKRCGSTDVRWRQQTGRWVLMSLKPGVEHRCELSDGDFGVVDETQR